MIQSVKKVYSIFTGQFDHYEIVTNNGLLISVPHNEENRHYQEILEWVENGGVIVDNGA